MTRSRRGTEVRQRQHQVGVRLLPAEMEMLRRQAGRDGVSPGEVLRRAFLREVGLDDGAFLRETYDVALKLHEFRAADLADALGISMQNANNRLKRLIDVGAARRERVAPERGGREYLYTVT